MLNKIQFDFLFLLKIKSIVLKQAQLWTAQKNEKKTFIYTYSQSSEKTLCLCVPLLIVFKLQKILSITEYIFFSKFIAVKT